MDWVQPVSQERGAVSHYYLSPANSVHFHLIQDGNESNYSFSEAASDVDYFDDKQAAKAEAEQHAFSQLEKAQVSRQSHLA